MSKPKPVNLTAPRQGNPPLPKRGLTIYGKLRVGSDGQQVAQVHKPVVWR